MKYFIALLASALLLYACGDDDDYGTAIEITMCNGEITSASDRLDETILELSEWSNEIRSYVASELAGYSIENIKRYKDASDVLFYLVELESQELLLFDEQSVFICAEGEFSSKDEDEYIPIENLPASIIDYINTNYPGIGIHEAEFEDGEYEIKLENDIELCFTAQGDFIGEC